MNRIVHRDRFPLFSDYAWQVLHDSQAKLRARHPSMDPFTPDLYANIRNPDGTCKDRLVFGFSNGYGVSIIPEMLPYDYECYITGATSPSWEAGWLAYSSIGYFLMPKSEPFRYQSVLQIIGLCRMIRNLPAREEPMADLWHDTPLSANQPNWYTPALEKAR